MARFRDNSPGTTLLHYYNQGNPMIRSRWICLCCMLLVPFFILSCSDPEKKKQQHYSKAMEFIQKDEANSAIIELRNAIQLDPKFAEARYQLGLLHLKAGQMKDAFGQLKRAADLDPANLDAGVKVAEFLLLSKNTEESRKYAEQVLKTDPANNDGLALLANLELAAGNHDAALKALDSVKGNAAESDRFYNIRGRVYAAKKDYQRSEEMFLKAIEQGPKNFPNYQTLLMFYEQQNKKDEAEKLLQKIIAAFPDKAQSYLLLADFYSATGQTVKAEEAALKAIALEPETESLYPMVAGLYAKQGQFSKSAELLENALLKFPDSLEIKSALADYYFELKRFDEAKAHMDAILASNPAHGGANFVKAKLELNANKIKEAIDILTSLNTNYPKWADPYYFLALAHLRQGEVELAQKACGEALQLSPANSRYHTIQSQIYLMKGESTKAGQEATTALKLDNRNFAAARLLAKALLQEKRFDEAIKLISKIRETVPDDIEMIGSLGLAYAGAKKTEEAKTTFSRLMELAPDNSKALAILTSLSAEGDVKAAIGIVEKQIQLAPKASGHYMLLGDLLLRDKQQDNALNAFGKAHELDPQNPQPYIIRARVMHAMGKTDDAIKEFQQLLASQPNSVPAIMGLATLYEAQKKYGEAKANYKKVLELMPDQPAAANNLAYLIAEEENGDLGEALRLAMLAKQAVPEDPNISDTLGVVHLKRESYGLAISQFQQALAAKPEEPVIHYHLALAQMGNNDTEAAKSSVQKALESKAAFAERKEAELLMKKLESK